MSRRRRERVREDYVPEAYWAAKTRALKLQSPEPDEYTDEELKAMDIAWELHKQRLEQLKNGDKPTFGQRLLKGGSKFVVAVLIPIGKFVVGISG